jgi:hypothetical protein
MSFGLPTTGDIFGDMKKARSRALPLERKHWRLGIAPKAARPGLLLLMRFTRPLTAEAFLRQIATFERTARCLANAVLPGLARVGFGTQRRQPAGDRSQSPTPPDQAWQVAGAGQSVATLVRQALRQTGGFCESSQKPR